MSTTQSQPSDNPDQAFSIYALTSSHADAVGLRGRVSVPGDKSISHRAMMLGATAAGETLVTGLLESEDVMCTIAALKACGAQIENDGGLWRVIGVGDQGGFTSATEPLDMGNSGTSTRLLLGLFAGYNISACFHGDASLTKRPMGRVTDPLSRMGAEFITREGKLPLALKGSDQLRAIEYVLPVASAQVKSAILLAGLNAHGITRVTEKEPTRDYTETMLRAFGATVDVEGEVISIEGGQKLTGCSVTVPADPSSAAFPVVAALITPGSDITLSNIGMNERRSGLYETLIEMGGEIEIANRRTVGGNTIADLRVRHSQLKGVTVPPERVPAMIDEFPVFAVAASFAEGETYMSGLEELRVKESDRLKLTAEGLKACGVECVEGEDTLLVKGTGEAPQGGGFITTALDHRIAMSFLVMGCAAKTRVTIDDSRAIATSFPNFVSMMREIGAHFEGPSGRENADDELELILTEENDLKDEIIRHLD